MERDIKYQTQIKGPFPLIKIQHREYIESLQSGCIYMNSLAYYRKKYAETEDDTIGDPCEGKWVIHNGALYSPATGEVRTLNSSALPTENENDYVFCMFSINPEISDKFLFNDEQKQKLIDFGDTALIITDIPEFFQRIKRCVISEGISFDSNFVNYYDEKIDDIFRLESYSRKGIKSVVFHKRKQYEYQQEYRFTVPNIPGQDVVKLEIGDISDISIMISTSDLFNSETASVNTI